MTAREIIESMKERNEKNEALVTRAFAFAERAHDGQKRFTGEPYFSHTFETAKTLASIGMDAQTIAAGLLHDALEDGKVSKEALEKEFGKEILFLVQGVTKLGTLKYQGLERHAESLRKLFIATAQDVRVLIIKLADRLHNIKTLHGHTRSDKQKRIALETIEIYAPIANRLGMGKLKSELERYAFPYAYPETYKEVKAVLGERQKTSDAYLKKTQRTLQKGLAKQNVHIIKTEARVKNLYSLYKKLLRYNMDMSRIYDIMAVRVVVPTIEDCYKTLGIVHNTWRPLPGRVKDYIAFPKPNGYQALHTTVFTGDGGIVEVQIRTPEMHREAEYGIASHIAYKTGFFEKLLKGKTVSKKISWLKELFEWQKHVEESGEFLKNLKIDFFKDRVFVFTPKGDVIDLPEDSIPVDFAYAIHSDLGDHMAGAKVNGRLVSFDTKLHNGDIVEILVKEKNHPTQKWLEHAKTALARKNIRNALDPEAGKSERAHAAKSTR